MQGKHAPHTHVLEETLVQPFGSQIGMFLPFGPTAQLGRAPTEIFTCAQLYLYILFIKAKYIYMSSYIYHIYVI